MPGSPQRFPDPFCAGLTRISRGADFAIIRPHGLSAWTLLATTGGRGRIGGPGGPVCARGMLVLVPPGVAHAYGRDPPAAQWRHLWLVFEARPAWLPLLAWPALPGADGYRILSAPPAGAGRPILAAIRTAIAERRATRADAAPLIANLVEQVLLRCHRMQQDAQRAPGDPRLERALAWMEERLDRPLRIAGIARSVGMSESRFAHAFRRQHGVSPGRWLEQRRMQRARELLLGGDAGIAAVAAACGFRDPAWFGAVFRRASGLSPSAFRSGRAR